MKGGGSLVTGPCEGGGPLKQGRVEGKVPCNRAVLRARPLEKGKESPCTRKILNIKCLVC